MAPGFSRVPPVAEDQYPRQDVDAAWAALKMILNRTRHLFFCRSTLTEETNEQDVQRIKTIFRKTQREHETRCAGSRTYYYEYTNSILETGSARH